MYLPSEEPFHQSYNAGSDSKIFDTPAEIHQQQQKAMTLEKWRLGLKFRIMNLSPAYDQDDVRLTKDGSS